MTEKDKITEIIEENEQRWTRNHISGETIIYYDRLAAILIENNIGDIS